MIYDYRCRTCKSVMSLTARLDTPLEWWCDECNAFTVWGRKYSVSVTPVMQEHFNHSVGAPISSHRQHADLLKAKSAELYAQTGIETNYVPIDLNDAQAVGATGEGIDESNRVRSKQGMPLLPEVK